MTSPFVYPIPTANDFRLSVDYGNVPADNWDFTTDAKHRFTINDGTNSNEFCFFYSIKDAMWAFFAQVQGGNFNDSTFMGLTNTSVFIRRLPSNPPTIPVSFLVCRQTSVNSFEAFIATTLNNNPALIQKAFDITAYEFGANGLDPTLLLPPYQLSLQAGVLNITGLVFAPTLAWNIEFSTSFVPSFNNQFFNFVSFKGVVITSSIKKDVGGYQIIDMKGELLLNDNINGNNSNITLFSPYYQNYNSSMTFSPKEGLFDDNDEFEVLGILNSSQSQNIILRLGLSARDTDDKFFNFIEIYLPDPVNTELYDIIQNWNQISDNSFEPVATNQLIQPNMFQKFIKFEAECNSQGWTNSKWRAKADLQVVWSLNEFNRYILLGVDGNIEVNGAAVNWSVRNQGAAAVLVNNNDFEYFTIDLSLRSLFSDAFIGTLTLSKEQITGTAGIPFVFFQPDLSKGISGCSLNVLNYSESGLTNYFVQVAENNQPKIPRNNGSNVAIGGAANNDSLSGWNIALIVFTALLVLLLIILLILVIVSISRTSKAMKAQQTTNQ